MSVLDLQRTAGNRAVCALVRSGGLKRSGGGLGAGAGVVQRSPKAPKPPSVTTRLATLEEQQAITAKRVAALEVDARWRARFGEKFADYEQVVHRISGGIEAATTGFQSAQQEQAQANALAVQVMGMMATVAFSAGLEWALTLGLGRLGFKADRIQTVVEAVENPLNTAAQGTVNIVATARGASDAKHGQTPTVQAPEGTPGTNSASGAEVTAGAADPGAISSPMAFLTGNLERLAAKRQGIEGAFATRAQRLAGMTPEAWSTFDPAAQNATYQTHYDDLSRTSSGISAMRSATDVAHILERHMWAKWIKAQDLAARAAIDDALAAGNPIDLDPNRPGRTPEFGLGGYVEDRLNALSVARFAGVVLTGHWWSSNEPDNWKHVLFEWASLYGESVANA
ncbi:hypothetical protein AB0I28_08970 [Phytomonospora sp. NPDC050363]|uniref:hypothetical protein n=1 Tax=Phytomonospora sp. NPDC050363 TaxID=3155642 RepID=UPI0033C560B7